MGAKSPYTQFKINGKSIPLAKSGLKVVDGKKFVTLAPKASWEVAATREKAHDNIRSPQ